MDGCYLSTEGIKPLKGLIYRFALDKRISVIDWLISLEQVKSNHYLWWYEIKDLTDDMT